MAHMKDTSSTLQLKKPFNLGNYELPHRVVMAPMTRARTTQPGNIPNELMAIYYAQRASAALIITEATQISQQGQGYSFTPGIHSKEHIAGWKKVTDAVHKAGGKIFLQLWHVGRMSHEMFHEGEAPVAPSAISPNARVWVADDSNPTGHMVECPTPRALNKKEIHAIISDFRQGAINAIEAGFDGVEIHGANGYLIDQFMRRTSNTRNDEYGGNIENRLRFMIEVVRTVVEAVGSNKTGIRLAPFVKQRGMDDDEAVEAVLQASKTLNELGIAYIHLAEADWDDAPSVSDEFRHDLRKNFSGAIIVAGNYTAKKAEKLLAANLVDLVAFGRPFIANPDFPARLFSNQPLRNFIPEKLFGGGKEGYIY
jgi:N-ethylmaleimide reductase